jgi:hypothetical protein
VRWYRVRALPLPEEKGASAQNAKFRETKAGSLKHHDTHPKPRTSIRPVVIARMSLRNQNGEAARRAPGDDSDIEEEAMANDFREQVQYDGTEDLDRMPSMNNNQDIHAQLQAAATPLEFQATLETKFASYDSYCNLFHYVLNSEGPVDLEVPNVREMAVMGIVQG